MRLAKIILSALSVALITPSQAWAQGDGEDTRRSNVIEEITVEARRVEESLQKTPIAVTAFSATTIDRMFAQDMRDIGQIAPNVNISAIPGFRAAAIGIRGVSTGDIPSSFDPAISVVVDGFVFGHVQSSLLDFFDIEQIEILRGPQGTLFGKNTIGGVINVRSKRPDGGFSAEARLNIGNFGRTDLRAAVNFPIIEDVLAGRVAVLSKNSSGDHRNLIDGTRINGDDVQAMRAKFLLTPSDNLEALFTIEYERDRSDTPPVLNTTIADDGVYGGDLFFNPNAAFGLPPGTLPAYPGRGVPGGLPLGDPHKTNLVDPRTHVGPGGLGTQPDRDHDFDILGFYLNLSYRVPNLGTFTWVAGYRSVESDLYNDYVGETVPIYSTIRGVDRDSWSQEVRFASEFSDRLSIVTGVYYQSNELKYYNLTSLGSGHPFTGSGFPGTWPQPGLHLIADGTQNTDAWAIFGEVIYDVSDRMRVFAGARYTDEKKSFVLRPLAPVVGLIGTASDNNSWDDITFRLGVDFDVTEEILAYFTFSTGFKSGGFNEQSQTLTAIGPFDEEKADSFELGIKSDLLDNRLRLNFAGFYVEYDDLQLDTVLPEPSSPVGQESRVTNAGQSTVWGLELEITALPTEGLMFQGTVGYLDAEYDEYACTLGNPAARPAGFDLVDPVLGLYDCSFLTPKRSPKWNFSGTIDYEWEVSSWGYMGVNINVTHSSAYFNDTLNSSAGRADKRTLLNASIRIVEADEQWELSVYGKNITDEKYRANGLGVANLWSFSSYGPPATFGVELVVKMGGDYTPPRSRQVVSAY